MEELIGASDTGEAGTTGDLPQDALGSDADCRPGWHAVHTRHQHEKVAARILACKGFEIFLPLYRAVHQWKDRRKSLLLPLFPCYVFVRGGLDRRLEIMTTPGVNYMVRCGETIALISDDELQAVRQIVECSVRAVPHPYLKFGDRVRIMTGPLAGIEGILVRRKNQCRLVVSVELLQRSIAIEVEEAVVERVSGGERRNELRVPIGIPLYA